ncbi:hypothetical protein [Mycobacterium tilburgii]|uniref:hypothetical protein n=1 Tax=Mycobacterium tilburgii TaxID=44467 RepID=UPI0021B38DC3|nr:hypothetical protein [Mycobacterium tilburgii]
MLFAARANPSIPARGTVAVCDFGGSGTSITLMDAAGDYQPLAPTVRHPVFSCDLIDQADDRAGQPAQQRVLRRGRHLGDRAAGPATHRMPQRQGATVVQHGRDPRRGTAGDAGRSPDHPQRSGRRVRPSLTASLALLDETLARNGIRDLVAVVSVGGGVQIPAVTTMLSGRLRVPVVTTPRPHLTPVIGAALRAAHGQGETSKTQLTPAAATAVAVEDRQALLTEAPPSAPVSSAMPALAWSDAADESRSFRFGRSVYTSARPALSFEQPLHAHLATLMRIAVSTATRKRLHRCCVVPKRSARRYCARDQRSRQGE